MEAFNTISAQDLAARIGQLPVLFEPGTAWHYGHSTDVLGAVLEVASGQTLDDLLEDRIFGPLSMEDTSFWVDEKDASRVAEPIFGPMTDNTRARGMLAGGHGLNSTAEDYARFALMLLNGGALDGTRILSASGLDLMREGTSGLGCHGNIFSTETSVTGGWDFICNQPLMILTGRITLAGAVLAAPCFSSMRKMTFT